MFVVTAALKLFALFFFNDTATTEIYTLSLHDALPIAPVTVTLNWHWLFVLMVAPESGIRVGEVVVNVPPRVVAEESATVSPVGSVSANATPVRGTVLAPGLVMVKVSDVVVFSAMVTGLKALAIEGGATTVMEAEAVPPAPPSVEVTLPVVLFWSPAGTPVTLTENVHPLLAARVAPDKLMLFVPATAVIVPPPQLPVKPLGFATTRPAGNVSLKPMPVSVDVFGLLIVKPSEVVPFNAMLAAPNDLLMVGEATTVMLAEAVSPVPASTEVTALVVLFCAPALMPFTFTENVHDAVASNVAPVRLTLVSPALS